MGASWQKCYLTYDFTLAFAAGVVPMRPNGLPVFPCATSMPSAKG